MLTPVDLQGRTFKSGMGYSKTDVDSFFSTLTSDYEALYRENMELKGKIDTLNDGTTITAALKRHFRKHWFLPSRQPKRRLLPQKPMLQLLNRRLS